MSDFSTGLTAPEQNAAHQLAALTSRVDCQNTELNEKDEIISVLTDRLEQVAEQLDRVKRSGADRGPRAIPNDVLAHQEAASAGISALVQQFDGIDFANSFTRLESLVGEVRELVIEQADAVSESNAASQSNAGTPDPAPNAMTPTSLLGGWDSIKNRLLCEEEPVEELVSPCSTARNDRDEATDQDLESSEQSNSSAATDTTKTDEIEADDASAIAGASNEVTVSGPLEPLPDDTPEPVDFENADRDDLVGAVEVRDRYISVLTRRIADRRSKLTVPTDWETIADAPEDLVANVTRLNDELYDAVRIAEVDICLERARLSRERTHLEQLKAIAETSGAIAADGNRGGGKGDDKSSRWRRALGLNGPE